MAAGPTPDQIRAAMRKAKENAEAYTKQHGLPCTPRFIRASNGEASIMYDIEWKGQTIGLFNLLTPPPKEQDHGKDTV